MQEKSALEISTVFADQTRHAIYRHILDEGKESYGVKEIAKAFSIHPNVARLHLTKLEEIGLLESRLVRGSFAGRPSKTFFLKPRSISLTFPPRDFLSLSTLTLEALSTLGESGLNALTETGRRHGRELMFAQLKHTTFSIELLKNLFVEQGLCPVVQNENSGKAGSLQICFRNCCYLEMALRFPLQVCTLHKAVLKGMLEGAFGSVTIQEDGCMISGDRACMYTVIPQEVLYER